MSDAALESALRKKTGRIVEVALEMSAEDITAIDIRKLSAYADHFVIATGRSDRQVRAIAESIVQALRDLGEEPLGTEGVDEGRWVLIDANDVVVHVFDPDTRALYDLERLWSDAPRVDLALPGAAPETVEAVEA